MAKQKKKFSQFQGPSPIDANDIVVGLRDNGSGPENWQFTGVGSGGGAPSDGTYIIQTADADLPEAQALDTLTPGLMSTDNAGVVSTHTIVGVPGEIVVTNGDGQNPGNITIGLVGGGSSGSIKITVTQLNTFVVGDIIRLSGTTYVLALANTAQNAEAIGMVVEINVGGDPDVFVLQQLGWIESITIASVTPFTLDSVYFLSESIAGRLTLTPPSGADEISRPVFVPASTTSGWLIPTRNMFVGTDGSGGGGGGGDGTNIVLINQPGHGFVVEDIVRTLASGTYTKAKADTFTHSLAVGVVVEINVGGDPDVFALQTNGYSDVFTGLTPATLYYLSDSVAGGKTTTAPTSPSSFTRPMLVSTTAGAAFILDQRSLPAGANPNFVTVNQVAHGFVVEDVVRVLGSGTYTKAQANSLTNARAIGIVVKVIDADNFIIQTNGYSDVFSGKTAATYYWLSDATAGLLTSTEPTANGLVSKPMFSALTTTSGYILEQRPMLQPNANGGGGGGGGGAWVLVASQTVAAPTAFVNFDNIFDGSYDYYGIMIYNVVRDGSGLLGVDMFMQIGTGGVPNYQTSDYVQGAAPQTSINIGPEGGASGEFIGVSVRSPFQASILLSNVNSTTSAKYLTSTHSSGFYATNLTTTYVLSGGWPYSGAIVPISSVRFFLDPASNFVSGVFKIYGIA